MNTTYFKNSIITQAINLGFDFEQFSEGTTVEEITISMLDFFNENSELLPRIEDECEVTSNGRSQDVIYGDFVSSGEIVDFRSHWADTPNTKVFHSNFVMEEGGIMKNMNLYYLVGETEYNAPDGFYFDKKTKSHIPVEKKYVIRDREAGNIIESNLSEDQANEMLEKFEQSDKKEGIYVPDFYEIAEQTN